MWIDKPNKLLNNIHQVKGQQKVMNGQWTFSPHTEFFSTSSNGKTNSVNMLHMVRDTKDSTVTMTSDPPLRGQRSKGHFHLIVIYNFIIRARFTKIYQQIPYAHVSLQNAGFNSERSCEVKRGHWTLNLWNSVFRTCYMVQLPNLVSMYLSILFKHGHDMKRSKVTERSLEVI